MIRKARVSDVKTIYQLLSTFSERGEILPRPLMELYENLRDFSVYCYGEQGPIVGTCAVHVSWEDLAEIRSLAVDEKYTKRGVGKALVDICLADAKALGIRRVFVLTYKTDFFEKRGFQAVEKSSLPHKVWSDCLRCVKFPDCDEIAMIKEI